MGRLTAGKFVAISPVLEKLTDGHCTNSIRGTTAKEAMQSSRLLHCNVVVLVVVNASSNLLLA